MKSVIFSFDCYNHRLPLLLDVKTVVYGVHVNSNFWVDVITFTSDIFLALYATQHETTFAAECRKLR